MMTEMLTVQAAKSSVSMITPQRSSSGADTGAAEAEALLAQTLGAEALARCGLTERRPGGS